MFGLSAKMRAVAPAASGKTLWAWGYNSKGGLGLGDMTNRSSPVQIGTLTTWSSAARGG